MKFWYACAIVLSVLCLQSVNMSKAGAKKFTTPHQPDSWNRWQFLNMNRMTYEGGFREAGTFLDSKNSKIAKTANLIQEEVVIGGRLFRQLAGRPVVYVFASDDKILYVGRSKRGLSRAISPYHQAHGARKECTSVRVFICRDTQCAKDLEACLIDSWRPIHNRNFLRHPGLIAPFVKDGEA